LRRRPAAGLALLTLLCVSCSGIWAWSEPETCPVVPVATGDLPEGLLLRSRVHLVGRGKDLRLEVVAQATPAELVVVGLTPFGMRLFTIRQWGRELTVETLSDRKFGQAALWVLDALHRIYWIEPPEDAAPGDPGSAPGDPQSWEREEERVSDWLEAGQRRRREFARAGADPAPARVSIDYPGANGAAAPDDGSGAGTSIDNRWCGYEAVWITLESSPARRAPGR
jgi:hypothetical protein